MKTTLEIPDDLYRQAKMLAVSENRKMKDIVSEGLRLALGLTQKSLIKQPRRMMKPPVTIRKGNEIRAFSNKELAALFAQSGEKLP